ncbi:hypothetical protein CBI38_37120 (plasmid) [Rhodococcus oxybenzonivorans]|uniref:Uncharacterized protein n=1 Tax=Rhodococcus oxybenzonivorans TaxID=1990687 RepID=A0A2S2C838_9NOCA|nr:hypothetical protein CBI38_37120 [Rhodococcus oxybenzonivorans]
MTDRTRARLLALDVPRERIFIDNGFSGTTPQQPGRLDNVLAAVTSVAAAITGRQPRSDACSWARATRPTHRAGHRPRPGA